MAQDGSRPTLPIKLIGASAGTGKTQRLATAFVDAVMGTSAPPIAPEKILAVTFTNKAADELLERVRHAFIDGGQKSYAQRAGYAYIGTVNAICGRLIGEHAFEAGLSPEMNVIPPEEVSSILARAADRSVDAAAEEIEDLASRLSYPEWRKTVEEISALARSNAIPLSAFDACARKSWESIQLLLPASALLSEQQLDDMLSAAINTAIEKLQSIGDVSKTTQTALHTLKEKRSALRTGRSLGWNEWAQLTKLKTGKSSSSLIQPVIASALNHSKHPRLHKDIQQFITAIFKCSAQVIEEYEAYKRLHGFVDFTDQEFLTLRMLDQPTVQSSISERIKLVLVDEFQDTSPIQLAIFSKLAQLVQKSIWVGDEKQAIYGFRGADPSLMKGVVAGISPQSREQLEKSYRSRPSLIQFTNDVFGMLFPPVGIRREHVCINECQRPETAGQSVSLVVHHLKGKTSRDAAHAVAELISGVLETPGNWAIVDKSSGQLRPARGEDIAVLCRTNDGCEDISNALSLLGVVSACQRGGLLQTSECTLAFAALRYLVDRNDSLAMAEILHIIATGEHEHAWLIEWLSTGRDELRKNSHELSLLDLARPGLMHATPLEALETAISSAGVVSHTMRWGNARTRLSNLDALRGLAMRFEDACNSQRRAATPAGLVAYLLREVAFGGEQPPSLDSNAVQVLTYHGSKGLEYPMVILLDLDMPKEPISFGVFAETEGGVIDAFHPLKDRWIRFWPWPYGQQKKSVYLDDAASNCREMIEARKRDRAENMRLLYVGTTRARDYLVLGCGTDTGWLDSLVGNDGTRILKLPKEAGDHIVEVGGNRHRITVVASQSMPKAPLSPQSPNEAAYAAPTCAPPAMPFKPLRLQPSSLRNHSDAPVDLSAMRIHYLGERFQFDGTPDLQAVGDAMHAFLAADLGRTRPDHERMDLARILLHSWSVKQLEPQCLVEASNRLSNFIERTYRGAKMSKECAVYGNIGGQRIRGRIDLLLEAADRIVIIDHKTFPGSFDQWIARSVFYRPQLALYAELACRSTIFQPLSLLVHLPIVGTVVDMTEIAPP